MSVIANQVSPGNLRADVPATSWGIEPVPDAYRKLNLWDCFVLWFDLGVGLLVIASGALLAPLGLGPALLAILVGSVVGSAMLAVAGSIGSRTAVPSMPLLRPVLGLRGSYLPSLINMLQLIGWTAFELWAMGYAAGELARRLFGFSAPGLWVVVFGVLCVMLTLGGPLLVVRQWLKRFGIWVVLASSLWITFYLATHLDLGALLAKPGSGGMSFWVGVDLVIAQPISWMPLVADYNRFARHSGSASRGTFLGYSLANIWFYALGALLVLSSAEGTDLASATGIAVAISAITAGVVALAVILVDETDNAFADLYSSAVSTQNIFPKLSQRTLILALGAISTALALLVNMGGFFNFLLVMSALFVPLFGLLLADYYVVRRRVYDVPALYQRGGKYWFSNGLNWPAIVAWVLGIVAFNVTNPYLLAAFIPGWGTGFPDWLLTVGGSIPGFLVAFLLYWLFAAVSKRRTI